MTSAIDITKPPTGHAYTGGVRQNFTAAKAEIEQLQDLVVQAQAAAAAAQAAADAAQAAADAAQVAADAAVLRDGDTMTGTLVLAGDPSDDLDAATRRYVDAIGGTASEAGEAAAAAQATADAAVRRAGDTMTGPLLLAGPPANDLDAATKAYADSRPGPVGPQGEPGAAGVQGPKGDTGVQGTPGATGDQGPQGDPGPKGDKGDTGAQGVPGTPADTSALVQKAGDTMTGPLALYGPTATLDVYPGLLGSNAGDTLPLASFRGALGNVSGMSAFFRRDAAGADWGTASFRLQYAIEGTKQGQIVWNPTGNSGGVGLLSASGIGLTIGFDGIAYFGNPVMLASDPTTAMQAATKQYADNTFLKLNGVPQQAVQGTVTFNVLRASGYSNTTPLLQNGLYFNWNRPDGPFGGTCVMNERGVGSGGIALGEVNATTNVFTTNLTVNADGTISPRVAVTLPADPTTAMHAATKQYVDKGVTSGAAVPAGNIGEYLSAAVATPGVTATTGTGLNITSLALTAGDWDVEASVALVTSAGASRIAGWISLTNGTSQPVPTLETPGVAQIIGSAGALGTGTVGTISRFRVNVAATTTVYLNGLSVFGSGTASLYGQINARRVR